jgi:hypothetical protein
MALDLIEAGRRTPGLDLAVRIARAGGLELVARPVASAADGVPTLAEAASGIDPADPVWSWRWLTTDYVLNVFVPAPPGVRAASLAVAPATTGTPWDVFLEALAEHLAHHASLEMPRWVTDRIVDGPFWWPVHGRLPSTRAAALAHSPASFLRRSILTDGRDLPAVTP